MIVGVLKTQLYMQGPRLARRDASQRARLQNKEN